MRIAVVTGGASGMGRGIALRLAADGNAVAVLDLDGDAAAATAKDIEAAGGKALGAAVDVSDRAAVDAAMDRVRAELGPIGIVVTSAGFDTFESFTDITSELWTRMLEVNLTGTFHCIQSAIPDMIDAGWGRIVTISSSSAQSGANRMAHYVASKGGVIGLTKALAVEYAPRGITVNTIPPGFIDTPMARRAEARGDLPSIDAVAARTPVRRAGTPEDIAAACAFLCSEEAGYVTGQALNVNGGWYL
jgi:NAD(P)-dependent dehydrogenase (short-subunit alcohol dehydrogenase family)